LKVLFEINKYEDDILNSCYKPTKNSQGVVQLEDTYYESDEDLYMKFTESITPDKSDGEQSISGSCYSVGDVKKFVYKLPTNQLFTMGFHLHPKSDYYCYCPCAKTVMQPWRKGNKIDFKVPNSKICKDKPI
jgi:hypothetical protein